MEHEAMRTDEERRVHALAAVEACAHLLKEQFGVQRVIPFGSLVGQGPWHAHSDVDVAVEGLRADQYISALTACWDLLPSDVELDLVPLEDASPELRAKILGEQQVPTNPFEALREEIQIELRQIHRVAESLRVFLERLSDAPDEFQFLSIGAMLHHFYSGAERLFERIAVRLDGDIPAGSRGHTDLLRRMEHHWGSVRPAVIDHPLALRLMDYLRFRHLFRHNYGFELEWDRCRHLAEGLGQTLAQLQQQIEIFLTAIIDGNRDSEEMAHHPREP